MVGHVVRTVNQIYPLWRKWVGDTVQIDPSQADQTGHDQIVHRLDDRSPQDRVFLPEHASGRGDGNHIVDRDHVPGRRTDGPERDHATKRGPSLKLVDQFRHCIQQVLGEQSLFPGMRLMFIPGYGERNPDRLICSGVDASAFQHFSEPVESGRSRRLKHDAEIIDAGFDVARNLAGHLLDRTA